jgi:hypothetical protein
MKAYILRDPQSVQPQKAQFLEPPKPQTEAVVERIVRPGERGPALSIGLDVHTDSTEVRRCTEIFWEGATSGDRALRP